MANFSFHTNVYNSGAVAIFWTLTVDGKLSSFGDVWGTTGSQLPEMLIEARKNAFSIGKI